MSKRTDEYFIDKVQDLEADLEAAVGDYTEMRDNLISVLKLFDAQIINGAGETKRAYACNVWEEHNPDDFDMLDKMMRRMRIGTKAREVIGWNEQRKE